MGANRIPGSFGCYQSLFNFLFFLIGVWYSGWIVSHNIYPSQMWESDPSAPCVPLWKVEIVSLHVLLSYFFWRQLQAMPSLLLNQKKPPLAEAAGYAERS
jgi:hypothetical protein